jgi:predicted component of type VI protein secretion system
MIEPRHVELRSMLDSWFIVPLTTSGGLSINGTIVRSQSRIRPGDKISIGTMTYAVSIEELIEREVGNASHGTTSNIPRLGEYFIQRGILTNEQVRSTSDRQTSLQRIGITKPFGEVAYELGYLNRSQLERAIAEQRSDFNESWHD